MSGADAHADHTATRLWLGVFLLNQRYPLLKSKSFAFYSTKALKSRKERNDPSRGMEGG